MRLGFGFQFGTFKFMHYFPFPPQFSATFWFRLNNKNTYQGLGKVGLAFNIDPLTTFTACWGRIIPPMCIFL